jgi:type 1 glutamine amidotransferase
MKKALFLYGGFPGHSPYEIAPWAVAQMGELDFEVEEIQDPHLLERDLTGYDLLVMGWTQSLTTEDLTDRAEARLMEAVRGGTGIAGWHGMTAAFRASLPYSYIVGGSFVEHPGGEAIRVPYEVEIVDRDHPVTAGVEDFGVASEQYYMHVAPDAHVLATTTFDGEPEVPWLKGVVAPFAWVKQFGDGRVFYTAAAHEVEEYEKPEQARLIRQGLAWAAR